MYIRFCKCNRRILTTEQVEKNLPCELCQKEHAQKFNEEFNIDKQPNREENHG